MNLHKILADPELTSELRKAASKGELCISSASFLGIPELGDPSDRQPRIGCMLPGTPSVDPESLEIMLGGEEPERPEFTPIRPPGITEQVVGRWTRPVVKVQKNSFEETDLQSVTWQVRLKAAKSKLEPAIRAVGRIEVQNHPRHEWVGTGWLVAEDIVITNRHVASTLRPARKVGILFAATIGPASTSERGSIFAKSICNPKNSNSRSRTSCTSSPRMVRISLSSASMPQNRSPRRSRWPRTSTTHTILRSSDIPGSTREAPEKTCLGSLRYCFV